MDAQLWFIVVVFVFVIGVWINTLSRWGYAVSHDEAALIVKPFLRRRVSIRWNDVRGPVEVFESFLPRLVVRVGEPRFLTLTPSYVVLLRGRAGEREVLEMFERTVGIKHIRDLGDAR